MIEKLCKFMLDLKNNCIKMIVVSKIVKVLTSFNVYKTVFATKAILRFRIIK